ncbi:hypothetical protein [Bacillus sp. NEB1478]|uniref:hypothetical protein n=1 Tax=Bacillus sp. NEB1478 TaxID=3073816 RepID=UPI002873A4CF|nr:hypothetical protein [Bacillus sp. NEB1478]WNB91246.1 hypothetical protein RGB74_15230 [Bacillus sp. NEB1478]
MVPKKTLYQYIMLMIVMVFVIMATKLCYHVWVNKSSIDSFNFNKAYFTATVISIVIFIGNIRQYKDPNNIPTSKNV